MRILVTGSRDWDDPAVIDRAMLDYANEHCPQGEAVTLVHGGAAGADRIAEGYAMENWWEIEEHPADWKKYGKAAGPIRNAEMVDSMPDVCLAFIKNKSRGATQCADYAEKAGIKTIRYEVTDG